MNVKANITYSIEDALIDLGQNGNVSTEGGVIVSTIQDKFFKGGGCEMFYPGPADPANGETIPRNIAMCVGMGA
jgi:hypothetical protein